ncbi:MAG: extracellular solute-binding protein, partial [Dehalococcoidia bacterium]|nr:extracellular solute-binding protein [Dehalococcoidia bacterium]
MKKIGVYSSVFILIAVVLLNGCRSSVTPTSPAPVRPAATQEIKTPVKPEWEQRWDKVVAGAKQEGRITVYGEVGPILKEKLVEGFQKKYGVEIEYVVGRPPEVAQRYLQEAAANIHLADLFITGQTTTPTILKPRGVLSPVKPQLILPEVLDLNAWPDNKLPFLDKDELVLALVAAYRSFIVVNTDLVKEGEVSSYIDLLDPRWKGKITLIDPTTPGSGGSWVAYVMLKTMGREEGEKYLRQLATQELAITRDTRIHVETVARGKYAIAIGALPQVVADLAQAGSPIKWAKMKEGGLVLPGSFAAALPQKPQHPNGSTLLLNHLLAKDGQLALSQSTREPARRLDVARTNLLPGTVAQPG